LYIEDFQLRWYIKIQVKRRMNEATVYSHYNKTNKYVTGTKAKRLDLGVT